MEDKTGKKKNKALKIVVAVICAAVIVFSLLNVLWYAWRTSKYSAYSDGMEELEFEEEASIFRGSSYVTEVDGYSYSVKYPDYLSTVGNISVSMPIEDDDDPFTNALVIWPEINGEYTYGVILYDDTTEWQIYVDESGNALDSEYDDIIEEYREDIDILFSKANYRWNLG